MVIRFKLGFSSRYGQRVYIRIWYPNNLEIPYSDHALDFENMNLWQLSWNAEKIPNKAVVHYQYFIRESDRSDLFERVCFHSCTIMDDSDLTIYDDWVQHELYQKIAQSKAFRILTQNNTPNNIHPVNPEVGNVVIRIFAFLLPLDVSLCITGSSEILGAWNPSEPLYATWQGTYYEVKLSIPFYEKSTYKCALVCQGQNEIIEYESGVDRCLQSEELNQTIINCYPYFKNQQWKGAGINIPVSAIRSVNSWGVGSFTDLKKLVDWAATVGFKMVQLLPVHDTTATYTNNDSYPYAAISAFALHPVYLDLKQVAQTINSSIDARHEKQANELNELSTIDFRGVLSFKWEVINTLFKQHETRFLNLPGLQEFISQQWSWLFPYAVFCVLRDKYKTADFSRWGTLSTFSKKGIDELFYDSKTEAPEHSKQLVALDKNVLMHMIVQYLLHVQLKDAVSYAHDKLVIVKGDIPIGIGRYSVETWMYPSLFKMEFQSGAPPDGFSAEGQNWGFPTYDWANMQKDNYSWWQQRLNSMSTYFDAIRIDHVLGFFRIWSIPMPEKSGKLGIFDPAIPMSMQDLKQFGIELLTDLDELKFNEFLIRISQDSNLFHVRIDMPQTALFASLSEFEKTKWLACYHHYFYERQNELWKAGGEHKIDAIQSATDMLVCAEDLGMVPYFVESVLHQREILSLQVQRMPRSEHNLFTNPANAAYLSVVTPSTHDMSVLRAWWKENDFNTTLFYRELLGEHGDAPKNCNPRFVRQIISSHLQSPAQWAVFLMADLLGLDDRIENRDPISERINDPANSNHVWDYRIRINIEELITRKDFTQEVKSLISESKR